MHHNLTPFDLRLVPGTGDLHDGLSAITDERHSVGHLHVLCICSDGITGNSLCVALLLCLI